MSRIQRIFAWGLFALVLMLLSGWLLADYLTPRAVGAHSETLPLQPAQTALDREIVPLVAKHGGKTGIILLPDGLDAFAARALSARKAGRSLDLQYYIWHNDPTGRLLAREAWQAAERGVRVRILLDDMNTKGDDTGLLSFDAHPNIEIRVYNPFRNRDGAMRVLELVQRFFSVNHRMHNKAWIADGRAAVLGGRNIGQEYFDASTATNFRDLDVVLFGPKVAQASKIFDGFWNSEAAVPISALNNRSRRQLDAAVARVQAEAKSDSAKAYLQRMNASSTVNGYFRGELAPHWSDHIEVASDPPLKWKQDDRSGWLVNKLAAQVFDARREALLISPYFVPGDGFTAQLVDLVRRRHVKVGVITNSLAANDVPAVHAGYSAYRGQLLDGGVALYELRAQGSSETHGMFGSSGASLHTKAFVIDGEHGFIGSFNLDPRSAYLNTEMGVLFKDRDIAAALREEYRHLSGPALSYQVCRDKDGALCWLDRSLEPPLVLHKEPQTNFLQRATARVIGWLPIESQL
ncbi:phospholipase D family protein [Luteimonas mephitis]|uniref:phospholipase D family protein n=1 Tax=Luteimonas mephitis TaxID=83615 RepID=UPI0003F65B63|nr:phospholipase D family protein [Luteimonas mephitis]